MLMMGLGQFNSDPAFVNCPPDTWFDSAYSGQCIPFAAQPAPSQPVTQSSGVPWWQSVVVGITQGAVKGIVGDDGQPTAPTPVPTYPTIAPQPWYKTTTGMVGIGVGAIALFLLLRK